MFLNHKLPQITEIIIPFNVRINQHRSITAVIISIYEGGVQPEMCSKTTGALADYFKSINYWSQQ